MSRKKTDIDSGVLITAFQGVQSASIRANSILNDENREFVSSQFVKLEVLPKAIYNQQQDETDFYETFFSAVSHWATDKGPNYTRCLSTCLYLRFSRDGCTSCCRCPLAQSR